MWGSRYKVLNTPFQIYTLYNQQNTFKQTLLSISIYTFIIIDREH